MVYEPRTRLNRLLLIAIGFMTLAIVALLGAIIWKLFLEFNPQNATPLIETTNDHVSITAE